MSDEPREALGTERDAPLHFAGRTDEQARLARRLERFRRYGGEAAAGGFELVIGVPGAGKTALLRHFAERSGAVVLRPDTHALEEPYRVFLDIGEAVGKGKAARKIGEVDSRRTGGNFNLLKAFAAGSTREHSQVRRAFNVMLSNLADEWPKNSPLVVLVDEIQRVSPDAAPVLQVLHDGAHGCPIMLVGGGLQHTPEVLGGIGISRVNAPIELHGLGDAAEEAFRGNLQAMRLGVTEVAIARLVAESHGFPQHIHCYLAAAQAVVPEGGTLGEGQTLPMTLHEGGQARAAYYQARLDMMNDDVPSPQVAMFRVLDALAENRNVPILEIEARQLFQGTPYENIDVISSAVRHGVLLRQKGVLDFGIPSFHSYLAEWQRASALYAA